MNITPITPNEKNNSSDKSNFYLDEAIGYFNDKIINRSWHDNFADKKEIRENYYAIIIAPFGRFSKNLLDKVVIEFEKKGWDCMYQDCYDARGPHTCFYVSKKHFEKE